MQSQYLTRAAQGPENVFWLASPCTSFCDWQLQNGGSRTFSNPLGGGRGPISEKETTGNRLAEFAAKLFETALEHGGFPIAESSGTSGRYPKMWDLPCWQRLLARPDVETVEFPMCAFGLGPPDSSHQFYRHATRVAFPVHPPLRQALTRRCPGQGANHQHVPLKGSRPGLDVTRCAEAGAYSQQFVDTIAEILLPTLQPLVGPSSGGGSGQYHAGGAPSGRGHQHAMSHEVRRIPRRSTPSPSPSQAPAGLQTSREQETWEEDDNRYFNAERHRQQCEAHMVQWATQDGHHRLEVHACPRRGVVDTTLLEEDAFRGTTWVQMCPRHAASYLRQRVPFKCSAVNCNHVGDKFHMEGLRYCTDHWPTTDEDAQCDSSRDDNPLVEVQVDGEETEEEQDGMGAEEGPEEELEVVENEEAEEEGTPAPAHEGDEEEPFSGEQEESEFRGRDRAGHRSSEGSATQEMEEVSVAAVAGSSPTLPTTESPRSRLGLDELAEREVMEEAGIFGPGKGEAPRADVGVPMEQGLPSSAE